MPFINDSITAGTIAMLDAVIVEPKNPTKHVVIWMHGLGASGHDFESAVSSLNLPDSLAIKFILPHAPFQPVTLNGGMEMRSWYDIKGLNDGLRDVDQEGIEASLREVSALIDQQINDGIDSQNIILAGFSQGGVIAGLVGLIRPYKLAGIILLSTYLPGWDYFKNLRVSDNQKIDFFIGHGSEDDVVPFKAAGHIKATLEAEGLTGEFHSYPIGHSICVPEVKDISQFITRQFSK